MKHDVIIVGGGLAGLTVAFLLHEAKIDFVLLEARDRLGGRILSADANGNASVDGFDLGPSWFWPDTQAALGKLIDRLGLTTIAQNSKGDVLFHRMARELPRRFSPVGQDQNSMRIAGGAGALVSALAKSVPAQRLRINAGINHVDTSGAEIFVTAAGMGGQSEKLVASRVVLAMPPRLLHATVSFTPELDMATADRWRKTPTWMAPHAKFFAIYDRAFWRKDGLSGTAQSLVGPMVEIHDATTASGKPALFGFLGVPASVRAQTEEKRMIETCLAQLAFLFGPPAGKPVATLLKDWARDPFTATEADQAGSGHPPADNLPWVSAAWQGRVLLAGSETSPIDPGYLAGAVEAAETAVWEIKHRGVS